MAHSGTAQHPNAALTPRMRRKMVDLVVAQRWPPAAVAGRFRSEGPAGLADRSSRPRRSPNRTSGDKRAQAVGLRQQRRCGGGPDRPRGRPGPADCAEHLEPHRAGPARPRRPGRGPPPRCAISAKPPAELVHVDIKKLAAICGGGGCRAHGRGQAPAPKRPGDRYCCLHTALDDRTRLACSEIPADEKAATAAGFWERARARLAELAIAAQRAPTDNGARLPAPPVGPSPESHRHNPQNHPTLVAPNQPKSRKTPPHPHRGTGAASNPGPPNNNAPPPTPDSPTTTTTTDPTEHSTRTPQPTPSHNTKTRTTSPKSTPSSARVFARAALSTHPLATRTTAPAPASPPISEACPTRR